jgi:hypothetical protein
MSIVSTRYRKASYTVISPVIYTQGAVNVVESDTTYSDIPILRTADSSLVKSVKVGSNVSYLATELAPVLEYKGSVSFYNETGASGGTTCTPDETYDIDYLKCSLKSLTATGLGENESVTISVSRTGSKTYGSYYYPTSLNLLCKIYYAGTNYSYKTYKIPIYVRSAATPSNIVLTASSPTFTGLYVFDYELDLDSVNTVYLAIQGDVTVKYIKPISGTSASYTVSPSLSYTYMNYIAAFEYPGSNSSTSTYAFESTFKLASYLTGDY